MDRRELSDISQISNITQQLHYRMKAKLKVPRRSSLKKDNLAGIEFKKN
jgi:hypothetical protein